MSTAGTMQPGMATAGVADAVSRAVNLIMNSGPAAIAELDRRIEENKAEGRQLREARAAIIKLSKAPNKEPAQRKVTDPRYQGIDVKIAALIKKKGPMRVGQICRELQLEGVAAVGSACKQSSLVTNQSGLISLKA